MKKAAGFALYIYLYICAAPPGRKASWKGSNESEESLCLCELGLQLVAKFFWGGEKVKKEEEKNTPAVTLAGKEKFLSSASASRPDAHLLTPLPVKVNLGLTSCPGGAATDFL